MLELPRPVPRSTSTSGEDLVNLLREYYRLKTLTEYQAEEIKELNRRLHTAHRGIKSVLCQDTSPTVTQLLVKALGNKNPFIKGGNSCD